MIFRIADEGDESMEQIIKLNSKKFINDFIFVCFLLGNDFVPNIVSLSLRTQNKKIDNGLDILFEKYGDVFADDYGFISKYKERWDWGEDDTGDISSIKNLLYYEKKLI